MITHTVWVIDLLCTKNFKKKTKKMNGRIIWGAIVGRPGPQKHSFTGVKHQFSEICVGAIVDDC